VRLLIEPECELLAVPEQIGGVDHAGGFLARVERPTRRRHVEAGGETDRIMVGDLVQAVHGVDRFSVLFYENFSCCSTWPQRNGFSHSKEHSNESSGNRNVYLGVIGHAALCPTELRAV
jgi:hypothetical protein